MSEPVELIWKRKGQRLTVAEFGRCVATITQGTMRFPTATVTLAGVHEFRRHFATMQQAKTWCAEMIADLEHGTLKDPKSEELGGLRVRSHGER